MLKSISISSSPLLNELMGLAPDMRNLLLASLISPSDPTNSEQLSETAATYARLSTLNSTMRDALRTLIGTRPEQADKPVPLTEEQLEYGKQIRLLDRYSNTLSLEKAGKSEDGTTTISDQFTPAVIELFKNSTRLMIDFRRLSKQFDKCMAVANSLAAATNLQKLTLIVPNLLLNCKIAGQHADLNHLTKTIHAALEKRSDVSIPLELIIKGSSSNYLHLIFLCRLPNLTSLHISLTATKNGITNEVISEISACHSLTHFAAPAMRFGNAGVMQLAQSESLYKVDLPNNGIQDEGAQAFAASSNIRHLNLSNNQITNAGALAFKDKSLDLLDLRGNAIDAETIAELRAGNSITTLLCDTPSSA